ncbi:MAG: hypothetical protein HY077_19110 [Elusimicrobia bacterium]|nr:hypothetical protein [Elusimicrobiota bacterium]
MSKKQWALAVGLAGAAVIFAARQGNATGWGKDYIGKLPDSSFASVEKGTKGERVPHLPYRDDSGKVDVAHLRSSLRLWSHVKWLNPAEAQPALGLLKNEKSKLCAEGRMTCGAKPKKPKQAKVKKPRAKHASAKPPKAKTPKPVASGPAPKRARRVAKGAPKLGKAKVARKPQLKKGPPPTKPV